MSPVSTKLEQEIITTRLFKVQCAILGAKESSKK